MFGTNRNGDGDESLLCDPASELRLKNRMEREKKGEDMYLVLYTRYNIYFVSYILSIYYSYDIPGIYNFFHGIYYLCLSILSPSLS